MNELPGSIRRIVLVMFVGAAMSARESNASQDTEAGGRNDASGPGATSAPPSAVVASSFEVLRDMLADPNGPRDIALLSQTYRGDLLVARPVFIHGQRGSTLEGTGTSTVLTVKANDVSIEDVVVRHSGHSQTTDDAGIKATGERFRVARARIEDSFFGVSLEQCSECEIRDVHVKGYGADAELRGDGIKLWEAHGSSVRDCVVERSRDVVVWYTRRSTLENNTVRGSRYGTHFMYAHDATIRRSHFENNVVGIFVMYSKRVRLESNVLAGARGAAGMGLGFKDSDGIHAEGNWLVANTAGTYLDNTPRTPEEPVVFRSNVLALNDVALRLHSASKGLSFSKNEFRQNAQMVEVAGGGDALSVEFRHNHYSDYEGYDLDGNGFGDVPFEVKALSSELAQTHPAIKFFHGTTAMGLVDAVAHAVPVFSARKLLVDPEPSVRDAQERNP